MSSPSTRIREARERLGLGASEVSDPAGLNDDWYFDVEHFDHEVTGNVTLDQLIVVARRLRLTPLGILEGPEFPPPPRRLSLEELAKRAEERMLAQGLSVADFSQRVGWEMAPVFADPQHVRTYTVDALQEICREAGVDWHAALPAELNEAAG
jgi:hypothetical protein